MNTVPLLARAVDAFPDTDKDELYALILCGEIFAEGELIADPRRLVPAEVRLEIRRARFVSRGGFKLDFALAEWGIDVSGKVFVDAGASTGGFTDCLLQRGAAFVHAVDVGINQLAYRLRKDSRVSAREKTNILSVTAGDLDPRPDAAVADLSFRSIAGAASHLLDLAKEHWLIALVKPQFELGRVRSGAGGDPSGDGAPPAFDGVIRDDAMREEVLDAVIDALSSEGAVVERRLQSPITGQKGNIEYLIYVSRSERKRG